MPSPLLSSQRLLMVIAGALLLNSQLPASVAGLAGKVLNPVVVFTTMPLHAPVHRVAVKLADPEVERPALPGLDTPEQLRDAYDMARVEIDRLRQEVAELKRTLELIEGVQAVDAPETRPLTAKVTAYTDAGPRQVLTINRGSRQNIRPGMTVVHKTVLVGRVVEPVGPSNAGVELVTAHDAKLQVRIRQPGHLELFDNIRVSRSEHDGQTFVAIVPKGSPIREGADVLLADAVYYADARGRLLGVVEHVAEYTPDPELFSQLSIRPAFLNTPYRQEVAVLLPSDE